MQELLTTLAKTAPFSRRGDQAMMSDLAADMVRRSHPEASKGKSRTSRSTGGEPAAKRQRAQTESAGVDAEALRRQTLATELLEKKAEVLAIERDLGTEATALSATSPQCEAAFNRLGEIFAEVSPPQSRCLQSLPFSIGSLCPLCPMKTAWQLRRPDRDFVLNDANALNLQIVALREKLALRCGATLWAADYWKSKSQNPAPDVLSPTPQPHTNGAANPSQRPAAPVNRRPRDTPAKTVKGARRSVMQNFSSMEVRSNAAHRAECAAAPGTGSAEGPATRRGRRRCSWYCQPSHAARHHHAAASGLHLHHKDGHPSRCQRGSTAGDGLPYQRDNRWDGGRPQLRGTWNEFRLGLPRPSLTAGSASA